MFGQTMLSFYIKSCYASNVINTETKTCCGMGGREEDLICHWKHGNLFSLLSMIILLPKLLAFTYKD